MAPKTILTPVSGHHAGPVAELSSHKLAFRNIYEQACQAGNRVRERGLPNIYSASPQWTRQKREFGAGPIQEHGLHDTMLRSGSGR